MTVSTRLALIALIASAAPGAASAAGPSGVPLAPHKIVYDLSLAGGPASRAVEAARGRIAFDFLGDNCEGYALNYRQVTVLDSAEAGSRTSDIRTTTHEAGDASSLRFRTEARMDGRVTSDVDGSAGRSGDAIDVALKKPKPSTFSAPRDAVFPSEHLKRLIQAGRAGQTTLGVKVYDGAQDGRKLYDTLAVIGAAQSGAEGVEAPLRAEAMAKLKRWPVSLSYFEVGKPDSTPSYVLSFELYENGVSRALKIDYGQFAIAGEVSRFELVPASDCSK